jgi:hypothetical protein
MLVVDVLVKTVDCGIQLEANAASVKMRSSLALDCRTRASSVTNAASQEQWWPIMMPVVLE